MTWLGLILFTSSFYVVSNKNIYEGSKNVHDLTDNSFKERLDSTQFWLVQFYKPDGKACMKFSVEYMKIADALREICKVGVVDMDKNQDLVSTYDISDPRTIMLFVPRKKNPIIYDGQKNAEDILRFVLKHIDQEVLSRIGIRPLKKVKGKVSGSSPGEVITLNERNFFESLKESSDHFLVEFYSPSCGHCRNLAPNWAEAARKLKGTSMRLAQVDATVCVELASKFGVNGYPTIKFIPAGSQNPVRDASEYTGDRTAAGIESWSINKLTSMLPPPTLVEMIDQETFDNECHGKPLCVISFVPDLVESSSKDRKKILALLSSLIKSYHTSWGWMWTEASSQFDFEDSFGIGGFGYPAMLVLNPSKKVYSVLKGSFDEKGIGEFLRHVQSGRTYVEKFVTLPDIKTITAWDEGSSAGKTDKKEEL